MKFSKQMTTYTSEITQFIAELKEKNPQLEQEQRKGRALLWDKAPIDLDQSARAKESRVDQQPYVYQNH
jgi:aspartate ammonia-lyase